MINEKKIHSWRDFRLGLISGLIASAVYALLELLIFEKGMTLKRWRKREK